MKNKFYITTSIAYTNAKPHIGYALELVQADVLARYSREKLGDDNTYFLTGTDDHGIKIFNSAKKAGKSPEDFVAENIAAFKKLAEKLSITNNDFISTSDKKKHWPGAQALWKALDKSGDIYKKQYEGLYCVGCESYLTKRELVDGKCPTHLKEPEVVKEENYFFRLTKYKDKVKKLIEDDELQIIPVERKHEVLNMIDEMEDVSFSRPKEKLPWGIPVPGDDSHVMYVWCDALSNYITALGYGTNHHRHLRGVSGFKKFWPADVHCVGKDILKFHAVIWPAMLLSVGLSLPRKIFVHGHITSDGKKMSKSLGNVVDPFEIIDKYGADALRYYLLREIPATGDGDFSWKRFEDLYNNELANELGNLVNRVILMIKKYDPLMKKHEKSLDHNPMLAGSPRAEQFFAKALGILSEKTEQTDEIKNRIDQLIENLRFEEALKEVWKLVREANNYIEKNKPWELAKNRDLEKLSEVLNELDGDYLSIILYLLEPFLPETSAKIQIQLRTLKPEPLFPRRIG